MPTPIPAACGELTKPLTACVKASHRVGCTIGLGGISQALSAAGQFIEPDLSSMMKMSDGIEFESDACVEHASPPPVPVLVPAPVGPPVPVVRMPAMVLPVPVEMPPVWVPLPEPPVSVPEPPLLNTEELPSLPQPPD